MGHMTMRVTSWPPEVCLQLLLIASLKDMITSRLHCDEHYAELQPRLRYCLLTRHLQCHQSHMVTVSRVHKLLEHSTAIVQVVQQAIQHADIAPEVEDAAVAEFAQSYQASTMAELAAKVLHNIEEVKATMDLVLNCQPQPNTSAAAESSPMVVPENAAAGESGVEPRDALEECWERLCGVQAAVEEMEELGVEQAADLRELEHDDVVRLGATLKKVQRSKLMKALGMN